MIKGYVQHLQTFGEFNNLITCEMYLLFIINKKTQHIAKICKIGAKQQYD